MPPSTNCALSTVCCLFNRRRTLRARIAASSPHCVRNATLEKSPTGRMIRCELGELADALPRSANVVDPELIGVAGPRRCRPKGATRRHAGRGRAAAKLMVQRPHQVLAHAPRQRLAHVGSRRYDQRQRLAILLMVVRPVPRSIHGKVVSPNFRHRVGITGSGARTADSDQGRKQTGGEDYSSDHDSCPVVGCRVGACERVVGWPENSSLAMSVNYRGKRSLFQ